MATSQRSTAATARMMLKRSISSTILLLRRIPAVSMKIYSFPLYFTAVSMASRVVPAISDTIERSSCASLLIRDDLPTFGFPIRAIRGRSSSTSSFEIFHNYLLCLQLNQLVYENDEACLLLLSLHLGVPV